MWFTFYWINILLIYIMIFAIGDSHSIFFNNSDKIKEHWVAFGNMPVTLYQLLKRKLDIPNIGNKLGNGHEKYNINKNDHVIFSYGWNDVQKNIFKYNQHNYEIFIDNMCKKYIELLLEFQLLYQIKPIVYNIMPNPIVKKDSLNGSDEIRKIYIKMMNDKLKYYSFIHNIPLIDIYSIVSNNGYIISEYTKDGIHLDFNNQKLRNMIDNYIYNFIHCLK